MEILQIKDLSFAYAISDKKSLENIDLSIKQGEFVLVCGESASGKSTLVKMMKKEILPSGKMTGQILVNNECITKPTDIGFVSQNFDGQVVTNKVYSELAFGLENMNLPSEVIRLKASEMAIYFGLEDIYRKSVDELSGGQKQLLNLASVMIMNPKMILLDEPTSQLDKIAADEFLTTLKKINEEFAVTIVIVEHRLEEVFSMSDRVIVMENGKIIVNDKPRDIYNKLKSINVHHPMICALPSATRIFGESALEDLCPINVKEGVDYLSKHVRYDVNTVCNENSNKKLKIKNLAIFAKNIWFRYEKKDRDILRDVNISVQEGQLHCLLGGNGSGKSTLISVLSGINKAYMGKVKIEKNLVLPQNPVILFVKDKIYDDYIDIGKQYNKSKEEVDTIIDKYDKILDIKKLLDKHPYDVSGGEIQKAALLKLLIADAKLLLLDEPTKGLDASLKEKLASVINSLKENGYTFFMVTHDVEFAASYADECSMIFDGQIITSAKPDKFFSQNNYFTTAASRIMRNTDKNIVTCEQAIKAIRECKFE